MKHCYRFKSGGESKTCPGERDSSESRCLLSIWSFQRANTSEAILWPRIQCHLKQRLDFDQRESANKKKAGEASYLSAGFVKPRGVQCFVRTAGVHHLHRCCGLFFWQQQLSALNTDIWTMSSAELASGVVRQHQRQLFTPFFLNINSWISLQ